MNQELKDYILHSIILEINIAVSFLESVFNIEIKYDIEFKKLEYKEKK